MTPDDLKLARECLGWTQRRLAEELGVPQSTIWRWESGKHKIERPRILLLAMHALTDAYGSRIPPPDDAGPDDPDF